MYIHGEGRTKKQTRASPTLVEPLTICKPDEWLSHKEEFLEKNRGVRTKKCFFTYIHLDLFRSHPWYIFCNLNCKIRMCMYSHLMTNLFTEQTKLTIKAPLRTWKKTKRILFSSWILGLSDKWVLSHPLFADNNFHVTMFHDSRGIFHLLSKYHLVWKLYEIWFIYTF